MRKNGIIFLILLLLIPLIACNESTSESIEEQESVLKENFSYEEAYKFLEALTAEEMEGRRAGTEGNRRAKEFIKEHFVSLELEPGGEDGTYYQWYEQQDLTFTKESSLGILNEDGERYKDFTSRKDFVLLRRTLAGENTNQFQRIFMDSEFSLDSPISHIGRWDINENLKIQEDASIILVENEQMIYPLLKDHRDQIEGLILAPRDPIGGFGGGPLAMYLKPALINLDSSVMDENTPDIMYITTSLYEEILSLKDQNYRLKATGGFTHEEISVANVIGRYPSSEDTKDTLLLVAHFDHLGRDSDGSINPGALDNASGTAVMMEMARVITQNNMEFPFHIEFVAFNGEEDGLLGSFHYADTMDHDPEDLKVINLDMVGSKHVDHLIVDFSNQVPNESLPTVVEEVVEGKELEYNIVRNSGGSDHIPFALRGADVVMFLDFSDEIFSEYYHNHYDTIDTIDKERLGLIGEILLEILEGLKQ